VLDACQHAETALVRLDCGAGGVQYRRYCLRCWSAVGGAIPHAEARRIIEHTGVEPPTADLVQISLAQAAYARGVRQ
jgi:hypothetical protein